MPRPVDWLVYVAPDGVHYLAVFDDPSAGSGQAQWYRWPAETDGWSKRTRCKETDADDADELPARLAALALQLSGVPDDD